MKATDLGRRARGRSRRLGVFGSLATLAAIAIGGPDVAAQSDAVAPLVDNLNRLERQIRALERAVYRGETPPPTTESTGTALDPAVRNTSQFQIRLDQFEEEVRALTGQIERMGFDLRQLSSRFDKLVADVDFRLRTLEQGGIPPANGEAAEAPLAAADAVPVGVPPESSRPAGVVGQLTESQLRAAGVQPGAEELGQLAVVPPAEPAATAVTLPAGPVEEQYNYAFNLLMQRDFDSAEIALGAFVDANPDSQLAGNAQYWLGETFYVRDDFIRAAQTFAEGYQTYPDSAKAPDNLLKLGLSLANLERTEDACLTLSKLRAEYSDAPANILQRAQREAGRLGCN